MANIWQGRFPIANTKEDGYAGTAPVGSFPPNGYGLYDMAGNVWEWCADWYLPDYYRASPARNPQGPRDSYDPNEPGLAKRVQRGGSFLCTDQYCTAYRPGGRGKGEVNSAASHLGFRCVRAGVTP
jgi:formylglycine-generating enzyme required for sulfatase activity